MNGKGSGIVIFRFANNEIDAKRRELRRGGIVQPLQPQAYAVLEYLVRHRDRVVTKQELLEALWPDAVVSEGSVHRAVSLARQAIDDDGSCIKTVPKVGYRFASEVSAVDVAPHQSFGRPRFARSGDVHIAFQTIGEGDLDVVLVPGWVFPMRGIIDEPTLRGKVESLARFGRVVLFDKRGTGLSDRVKSLPTLEERMDDLRAVLEEIGSHEVLLVGYSEGGALCLMYATTYPERTRGVLLVGAFARWLNAPEYTAGWTTAELKTLRQYIETRWGSGDTVRAIVESRANDPAILAWAARTEQEGASPGAALELLEMNVQVDVRPILQAVSVPTVVIHHTRDSVIRVESSRYLASRIPGARLLEIAGTDHLFAFEGWDDLVSAIETLLQMPRPREEWYLTTLVAIGGEVATDLDDVVSLHRGERAAARLFSFDGPQRALRFARAVVGRQPGLSVGVHAGEVSRERGALAGPPVAAARRVAGAAPPGEVLVSHVVRDLVHGSGLELEPRGEVTLPGGASLTTFSLRG